MIWYDMIWYDMIWYDMIWYDMIWYDMIWYDMIWYDIFVNCKWVATRWQLYNTHLHTNSTQNDTKQTIHRTTQNLRKNNTKFEKNNTKFHILVCSICDFKVFLPHIFQIHSWLILFPEAVMARLTKFSLRFFAINALRWNFTDQNEVTAANF